MNESDPQSAAPALPVLAGSRFAARLDNLRAHVTAAGNALTGLWRRSLQLRVVVLTLAITSAVAAIIGYVLITQMREQLLDVKEDIAIEQSTAGVNYLIDEISSRGSAIGADLNSILDGAVQSLQADSSGAGEFYVLALSRTSSGTVERTIAASTTPITAADLPTALQADVQQSLQVQQITQLDLGNGTESVTIVGSAVPSDRGDFELYYVYPLQNEREIMTFVERTVIAASIAFMVMIPGIGLLVSRLVVLPVRSASRTAQRLASGELSQRMEVRGEDDLAKLAMSFNGMAGSLSSQISSLEMMSQVQQRFSSDVSHELRTPLTTVRMAADMLYDYREDFPEIAARSAELLHTELDRFESLLGDLLEISRYDAGGLELDAELHDIGQIVDDVAQSYQRLAQDNACELSVQLVGASPSAEVDARRYKRVLRNLVSNAIEHGDAAPIVITLAGDESVVAVTVRDHGVGVDQVAADRLFDRFWRADPSRVRKLGGTGLGMAISLEDVLLHNGWLHVWGKPGSGCNFRVTVPLIAGAVVDHSPLPLVPTDQTGGALGGTPHIELAPPEMRTGGDLV